MGESGKKIILLADDDVLIRRMYRTKFENEGFEVEVAVDGEQALESAASKSPHIVLLDVRMPGTSGIDALKRFREIPHMTAPIILLSNMPDCPITEDEKKHYGVVDYIVKANTDLDILMKRINTLIEETPLPS